MDPITPTLLPIVGIAYSLWHFNADWSHPANPRQMPWGTPLVGYYSSDDQGIVRQHAEMMHKAGIDFIYLDWSNDIDTVPDSPAGASDQAFIEDASRKAASTYAAMARHPKISIMLGVGKEVDAYTNGKLQRKADQVYTEFAGNAAVANIYQRLDGKPLLIVYADTPTPFAKGLPPWNDERFTVRYMSGFLTEQPDLLGPNRESKYGYWSWEDRGEPTFATHNGRIEAMTVVAAWRPGGAAPDPGRSGGETFLEGWARARALKPRVVLAGTFNEWWMAEQPSPELSKDVEPSVAFGTRYLDIIREQSALLRAGK